METRRSPQFGCSTAYPHGIIRLGEKGGSGQLGQYRYMKKTTQKDNEVLLPSQSKKLGLSDQGITKKYSLDETRALFLQNSTIEGDLNKSLARCSEILSRSRHGNERDNDRAQEELQEPARSVMYALEVETHLALMESFSGKYRGMAKELCDQIIKENDCSTHTEKMLAETIAASFVRYIDSSKQYNRFVPDGHTSSEQNQLIAVLSKQADRAHRQFLASFAMLKQIKQPQLEVNIKVKNAFVAENQQINVDRSQP